MKKVAKRRRLTIGLLAAIVLAIGITAVTTLDNTPRPQTKPASTDDLPFDGIDSSESRAAPAKPAEFADGNVAVASVEQRTDATSEIPTFASHASAEGVPGLEVWLSDVLPREWPYVENEQVLIIDTLPVLQHSDEIRLQLLSSEILVVSRTGSLELPGGGIMWSGRVNNLEDATVSIEISPIGEAIVRVSTLAGRVYVRPSPMLPYHVAYTRNPEYKIGEGAIQ